jgi:hypothetical protein
MKRIVLSIVLLTFLFTTSLFSQDSPFDKLIEKYGDKEGITTVIIGGEMFSLFSEIETDEENEDVKKLMQSLKAIKIINIDKSEFKEAKLDYYYKLMETLPEQLYVELMTIKEKDENVRFFIKKLDTGKIGEMIMLASDGDDNTLISISGIFDLNDMTRISRSLGIQGLEKLERLEMQEEILEEVEQELQKKQEELEKQRKELEKQRKEFEKQMQEMEKEQRK